MSTSVTDTAEKQSSQEVRFIGFLKGLAEREDRGALAKLRRGLGKVKPTSEAWPLLIPRVEGVPERQRDCYFLVAALFALYHDAPGQCGNMGETFKAVGDHESAQKRFVAMLDSDVQDLPHRLRQAISIAKSKGAPVNWLQLLKDIIHWESDNLYVQYKWAGSYWKAPAPESDTKTTTPTNEKEGE